MSNPSPADRQCSTDLFCVEQLAALCDIPRDKRSAALEIIAAHVSARVAAAVEAATAELVETLNECDQVFGDAGYKLHPFGIRARIKAAISRVE